MAATVQVAIRPRQQTQCQRQRPDSSVLTAGPGRWLRGAAVGGSATCLALGGHVLGGGGVPAPARLSVLTLVAVLGAVSLSGQRWTFPSLLSVLLGAQAVFHVAAAEVTRAPGQPVHTPGAHEAMAAGGWWMLVVHAAAAALTALVLRRGEDACWRAAHVLMRPLTTMRALRAPRAPAAFSPVRTVDRDVVVLRFLLLVCAAPRRGPPAALAS